jgi:hypothetical protein
MEPAAVLPPMSVRCDAKIRWVEIIDFEKDLLTIGLERAKVMFFRGRPERP